MRLLIEWLWNYIRVLLYGKLFKEKVVKKVRLYNKPSDTPSPSKEVYLTYKDTNASVPKHNTRIKNRRNRKRRHKK